MSEEEEELASDSSDDRIQAKPVKKSKAYSIGYLSNYLRSKKIYSDDFDADYDKKVSKIVMHGFKIGSVKNQQAIQEDSESSEIENPYFSDNSSSSALTTKLRMFSKDCYKILDKSDTDGSVLSFGGRSAPGQQQK